MSKIWLERSPEPWPKVLELWSSTSEFRQHEIKHNCSQGVCKIFRDWPQFKDLQELVALYPLPSLLAAHMVHRTESGKRLWRPSIVEMMRGFIILIVISNDMQKTLSRRRYKLHAFGIRMQPFVVVVGTLVHPSVAYIVADDGTWKVSKLLKAVDVCFKTFHVLHASYPAETSVWFFAQQLIHKVTTKWDVKSAADNITLT